MPSPSRTARLCDAIHAGDVAHVRAALATGTKVDTTVDGDSLLALAARAGHLAVVRELLARGARPGHHRDDPPLAQAIWHDAPVEVVEALLAAGADPHAGGAVGIPALTSCWLRGQHPDRADATSRGELRAYLRALRTRGAVPTEALLAEVAAAGDREVLAVLTAGGRVSAPVVAAAAAHGHVELARDLAAGLAEPALLVAIWRGDRAAVARELAAGADRAAVDDDGVSALVHAARMGRLDIVALLRAAGPPTVEAKRARAARASRVEVRFGDGELVDARTGAAVPIESPLLAACRLGRTEVARACLAAGDDPDAIGVVARGAVAPSAPLIAAARRGDAATLKALLAAGARVTAVAAEDALAAAIDGGHRACAELLLRAIPVGKPELDAVAACAAPTLAVALVKALPTKHRAAVATRLIARLADRAPASALRALFTLGGDADARDDRGVPALHRAAARGDRAVVDAFLAAGARPVPRHPDGNAAQVALRCGHRTVAAQLLDAGVPVLRGSALGDAIVRADRKAIAAALSPRAVAQRDAAGWSPLTIAVACGDAATVDAILAAGPPAPFDGPFAETPLATAVALGRLALVERLLAHAGWPPSDPRLDDALRTAARHGMADVVAGLLAAGVPVERPAATEPTPLFEAAHQGYALDPIAAPRDHDRCVELLLAAGANPLWRAGDAGPSVVDNAATPARRTRLREAARAWPTRPAPPRAAAARPRRR